MENQIYLFNMNKKLKILLITFGSILTIGGGYLLYKKLEFYKDRDVRKGEEKFESFGKILESSNKKLPNINNWYKDLPLNKQTIIENSFLKMSNDDQLKIKKEFKKGKLSNKTISLLKKVGYNN